MRTWMRPFDSASGLESYFILGDRKLYMLEAVLGPTKGAPWHTGYRMRQGLSTVDLQTCNRKVANSASDFDPTILP